MKNFYLLFTFLISSLAMAGANLSTNINANNVSLFVYQSDFTLVNQSQSLSFNEGLNQLAFNWQNQLIDPSSINITIDDENASVVNTSFPSNSKNLAIWNILCDKEISSAANISYFTSSISWKSMLKINLSSCENFAQIENVFCLTNNSGKDYQNAQMHLVLGDINLKDSVKKLALMGAYNSVKAKNLAVGSVISKDATIKKEVTRAWSRPSIYTSASKENSAKYEIFSFNKNINLGNNSSIYLTNFKSPSKNVKVKTFFEYKNYQLTKYLSFENKKENNLGKSAFSSGSYEIYSTQNLNNQSGSANESICVFNSSLQNENIPVNAKAKLKMGFDKNLFNISKTNIDFEELDFYESKNPIGILNKKIKKTIKYEILNNESSTKKVKIYHKIDERNNNPKEVFENENSDKTKIVFVQTNSFSTSFSYEIFDSLTNKKIYKSLEIEKSLDSKFVEVYSFEIEKNTKLILLLDETLDVFYK